MTTSTQSEHRHGPQVMVFVREAGTHATREGRYAPSIEEPLDAEGRKVAAELREKLAPYEGARVFQSPLARARETCELSGFAAGATIEHDLREWEFGEYAGRTVEEIRVDNSEWAIYLHGCPGGEDSEAVGARADAMIGRITAGDDEVAVVFSHGHFLRSLCMRWIGISPIGGRHLALAPASISSFGYDRGVRTIVRWNS
jgi:broad specificity phosphatase PhoE